VKVGDLIICRGPHVTSVGILIYDNDAGGTLKIFDHERGQMYWVVKSECEVLNESR